MQLSSLLEICAAFSNLSQCQRNAVRDLQGVDEDDVPMAEHLSILCAAGCFAEEDIEPIMNFLVFVVRLAQEDEDQELLTQAVDLSWTSGVWISDHTVPIPTLAID